MNLLPAITLALTYNWGGAPSVEFKTGAETWSCASRTTAELNPFVLTWSPEDGFGARSDITASQYAGPLLWCK